MTETTIPRSRSSQNRRPEPGVPSSADGAGDEGRGAGWSPDGRSSLRISAASSCVGGLAAIDSLTSSISEPSNARSARSRSNWRLVCCSERPRAVHVRARRLVAEDQPLLEHDLQQLQRGRVAGRAVPLEHLLHLADGARPSPPEHAEDRQLGVGRSGRRAQHSRHTPRRGRRATAYFNAPLWSAVAIPACRTPGGRPRAQLLAATPAEGRLMVACGVTNRGP